MTGDEDFSEEILKVLVRFSDEYQKILSEEYVKSLKNLVEQLERASSNGLEDMTGFKGIVDRWTNTVSEFGSIWHVDEQPEKFTPEEFEKLWNSFPEERKVQYVLSLIEENCGTELFLQVPSEQNA